MNDNTETKSIDELVARARCAQQRYEATADQQRYDRACQAVAWALMEPVRNHALASRAVADTGLGNVEDKITKNTNKTLGLMRDIKGVRATGHVGDDTALGISTYMRPKGVVAAIVPSTNPLATPVNNAINALKSGNAIILAPSPKGTAVLAELLGYIHAELRSINEDPDLVQMVPSPPSKAKTARLMELADLVVVTGSRNNVRAGYSSGTPALGVGVGNVVTIIDETADVTAATKKIAASKVFDNATSCSSENAIIAVDAVYDAVVDALAAAGGMLLSPDQVSRLEKLHWHNGHMTAAILAKDIAVVLEKMDLADTAPEGTRFLVAPTEGAGPANLLSGEKMARFLALYRASDFTEAAALAVSIQNYMGAGHSLGLHSALDERAHFLAANARTCRIIVNQAHCFANGGFFNNGMPFSLSMGCGSWGGNSIDENLNWKHFVNNVKIVREIPENRPSLEDIFGEYWQQTGSGPRGVA